MVCPAVLRHHAPPGRPVRGRRPAWDPHPILPRRQHDRAGGPLWWSSVSCSLRCSSDPPRSDIDFTPCDRTRSPAMSRRGSGTHPGPTASTSAPSRGRPLPRTGRRAGAWALTMIFSNGVRTLPPTRSRLAGSRPGTAVVSPSKVGGRRPWPGHLRSRLGGSSGYGSRRSSDPMGRCCGWPSSEPNPCRPWAPVTRSSTAPPTVGPYADAATSRRGSLGRRTAGGGRGRDRGGRGWLLGSCGPGVSAPKTQPGGREVRHEVTAWWLEGRACAG
jgi:hypothetical protein